jgi:hypothetical protein
VGEFAESWDYLLEARGWQKPPPKLEVVAAPAPIAKAPPAPDPLAHWRQEIPWIPYAIQQPREPYPRYYEMIRRAESFLRANPRPPRGPRPWTHVVSTWPILLLGAYEAMGDVYEITGYLYLPDAEIRAVGYRLDRKMLALGEVDVVIHSVADLITRVLLDRREAIVQEVAVSMVPALDLGR